MAIPVFSFTKNWNDPEDFPPVVSNATQARANIQLLHDETKAFINDTLAPAIQAAATKAEEAVEAAEAAATVAGGTVTVGTTAPSKTNGLWVDTGNGGIIKYYDVGKRAWTACSAVWK